jgi:hypothetical protein
MMAREYTRTPEANLKRRRTLSEKLNDPDRKESDAKRAVAERLRRAQHKRNIAKILRGDR